MLNISAANTTVHSSLVQERHFLSRLLSTCQQTQQSAGRGSEVTVNSVIKVPTNVAQKCLNLSFCVEEKSFIAARCRRFTVFWWDKPQTFPPEGETASSQQTIRSRDKISWRINDQKQEVVWHSDRAVRDGGVTRLPARDNKFLLGRKLFFFRQSKQSWNMNKQRSIASVLLQEKLPAAMLTSVCFYP